MLARHLVLTAQRSGADGQRVFTAPPISTPMMSVEV